MTRGDRHTHAVDTHGVIPANRLAAALKPLIDRDGPHLVAHQADTDPRRIWAITSGECQAVSWTTADLLLTRLDLTYLWHWPPEQGGFSDLYEDTPTTLPRSPGAPEGDLDHRFQAPGETPPRARSPARITGGQGRPNIGGK